MQGGEQRGPAAQTVLRQTLLGAEGLKKAHRPRRPPSSRRPLGSIFEYPIAGGGNRRQSASATTIEAYNQLSPGPAEAKGDPPLKSGPRPFLSPWGLAASAAGFGFAGFARIRGVDWPCGQNPGRKPKRGVRRRASAREARSLGEQSSTCGASTLWAAAPALKCPAYPGRRKGSILPGGSPQDREGRRVVLWGRERSQAREE
jgi:hypothetical protein